MEFASGITGFIEFCSWRSRAGKNARESSFNCMSPVVASRSCLVMPSASTLTRRPAPGVCCLGFGAWRIACDSQVRGHGGAPLPHHSQRRVKRPGSVSDMTSQNCWSKALNAPNSAPSAGKSCRQVGHVRLTLRTPSFKQTENNSQQTRVLKEPLTSPDRVRDLLALRLDFAEEPGTGVCPVVVGGAGRNA